MAPSEYSGTMSFVNAVACLKFEANIFDRSRCQNCFKASDLHRKDHGRDDNQFGGQNLHLCASAVSQEDLHVITPDCNLYRCSSPEEVTASWQMEPRIHNHLTSQFTRKWAVDTAPFQTSELSSATITRGHTSRGERMLGSSASALQGEGRNWDMHSDNPTWSHLRNRMHSWGWSDSVETRGKAVASVGGELLSGDRVSSRNSRMESGYFSLERLKQDSVHNLAPSPRQTVEIKSMSQSSAALGNIAGGGGVLSLGRLTSSQSSFESESSCGTGSVASSDGRLLRRDYTVLADIPMPKRIISREKLEQDCKQLGQRNRTRSPGREEVERLFGQERRPVTDTYRGFSSANVGNMGRVLATSHRFKEESRKSNTYPRKFQQQETNREIPQQSFSNLLKSKDRDTPSTNSYEKMDTKFYSQKDESKFFTKCSRVASETNKAGERFGREESKSSVRYLRSPLQNGKKLFQGTLQEPSHTKVTTKPKKILEEPAESLAKELDYRFSSQDQNSHTGYAQSSPKRDKTSRGFSNRTSSDSLIRDLYLQTSDKHNMSDRGFSSRMSLNSINRDIYLHATDNNDKTDRGFSNRTSSNSLSRDVYLQSSDNCDKIGQGFSNRTSSNSLNRDVHLQSSNKPIKGEKRHLKFGKYKEQRKSQHRNRPFDRPSLRRSRSSVSTCRLFSKVPYQRHLNSKHTEICVRQQSPGLACIMKSKMQPDLLNFKKGWMSILDDRGEWKKHWFVLTDSSLRYYRDCTAEEANNLDGEIDLRSCSNVTEYQVQRNYGFQIHTKESTYTLSAMTSGIRRNWIEALRTHVRPTTVPDVTKRNTWMKTPPPKSSLTDSNKENTFRDTIARRNAARQETAVTADRTRLEVPRSTRRPEGHEQLLPPVESVELEPVQSPAKAEELTREQAQRIAERSRWFESTNLNDCPRKEAEWNSPLVQISEALSKDIEVKWQELERIPLRDHKQVPIMPLQSPNPGVNDNGVTERLKKEISSLNVQLDQARRELESFQEQRTRLQGQVNSIEGLRTQIPKGFISQETCERNFREMEESHRKAMEELQRQHKRELDKVQQDKDRLLSEEADATISAIEAVKKAHREELERLRSTQNIANNSDLERLRKQHQEELESLQRELQVLSEQYSRKCLEINYQMKETQMRERDLSRSQRENEELLRQNRELNGQLSEEIARIRALVTGKNQDNVGNLPVTGDRDTCELEVLLRIKENEVQNLRRETMCLRDELQSMQWDKKYATDRYNEIYTELSVMKVRTERELNQVKEQLKLAMAALKEKDTLQNSITK
ncbi:TRIO and F-actin binding protein b isoform X3 [Stegostoma tigrinum]|uniref:TRIO and F-actin binding protein b isoform X3 n=1 Tax=Stegostoma tigrinum TaxID=3053191 RepID=UPI002870778B|nr:TRIO and F-actin binding protein b isoform X3 [Stegostoma tigrinum]